MIIERIRRWRHGIQRLSARQADKVNSTEPCGILVELVPSRDRPKLTSLPYLLKSAFHPEKTWKERISFWKAKKPMTFEVWSDRGSLTFLHCAPRILEMRRFTAGLHVLFPHSQVRKTGHPFTVGEGEYVCSGTVTAPILHAFRPVDKFDYDPLRHVLETLSKPGAKGIIQVCFKPMEWNQLLRERLKEAGGLGKGFETVPRFEVLVRFSAVSKGYKTAYFTAKQIGECFKVLEEEIVGKRLPSFSVIRTSYRLLLDIFARSYPRMWDGKFLLEASELATLVHLPVRWEGFGIQHSVHSLSPPPPTLKRDVTVGRIFYRGRKLGPFGLTMDDMMRGQYVIGASGTGKTVLLTNEAVQVFKKGVCVHVLDPHGDMSYDLLESLEPKDLDNAVFLDPLLVGYSINPFELPKHRKSRDIVVERIIGEMVETMKRLFGAQYWGPSLNRTFQNACRLLYCKSDSPTFLDLFKLLRGEGEISQQGYAQSFLREIGRLPTGRVDAVLNKIEPFVRNKLLRKIFCSKSTLDFDELTGRKLVIWRLSKGELSETNMSLIGSGIITKLWYYTVSKEMGERIPLFIVIDEFQNFAALETLDVMLTEGRKYRVSLALAHQSIKQIPAKILNIVLGNTATKIVFRVPGDEAYYLSRTIYPQRVDLVSGILTNLPDGQAVVQRRAGFGEEPIPAFQIATFPPREKKFYDTEAFVEKMKEKFKAPTHGEPAEEKILTPDVYDLLRIVYGLMEKGAEPTAGATLQEFRRERPGMRGSRLSHTVDRAESLGLVKRNIVKQKIGRPKVVLELTEKGMEKLGVGIGLGRSVRAGGELHRAMIMKLAEHLRRQGYFVVHKEQGGPENQPDITAFERTEGGDWGREIAIEVETRAQHPDQVWRNFEKNINSGREVVFVVPDEKIKRRIENILGKYSQYTSIEIFDEVL